MENELEWKKVNRVKCRKRGYSPQVRRHKEEQRCRFEELEQLIEMTRSKVDLQVRKTLG